MSNKSAFLLRFLLRFLLSLIHPTHINIYISQTKHCPGAKALKMKHSSSLEGRRNSCCRLVKRFYFTGIWFKIFIEFWVKAVRVWNEIVVDMCTRLKKKAFQKVSAFFFSLNRWNRSLVNIYFIIIVFNIILHLNLWIKKFFFYNF